MLEMLRETVDKVLAADPRTDSFLKLMVTYYERYICDSDHYDPDGPERTEPLPQWHELRLALDRRPSGIGEALEALAAAGVNVCDEGDEVLRTAVGAGDAFFVEWLLEHGADPTVWSDREPWEQNRYLDEVDLIMMDESFANDGNKEYIEMLAKTAQVLVKKGGLRNFGGYCFSVDEEGVISFFGPKVLF